MTNKTSKRNHLNKCDYLNLSHRQRAFFPAFIYIEHLNNKKINCVNDM